MLEYPLTVRLGAAALTQEDSPKPTRLGACFTPIAPARGAAVAAGLPGPP